MRDLSYLGNAVYPKQLPLETWLPQQWEVAQFIPEGTGIRGQALSSGCQQPV